MMGIIRQRSLEVVAWVVVAPAIALSLLNADIFRLAIGAFGPPPDTSLRRVLLFGAAVAGLAWWLCRREDKARASQRHQAALLIAALLTAAFVTARAADLRRRNVSFQGNGISIAATIYEPRIPGKHPAVVFVGGSAPFKRGLYALWAEHLARIGVIAIVPDKRGVGGTGGEFERNNNTSKANLTLLAGDAVAALDFAARQSGVDTTRLGLFGVSQAGWSVPMAAVASIRARFIVMVTGPTVSVREEGVWSELRGDDHASAKLSLTEAEHAIDTVAAGGVDARPRLAALNIPGLWLFGSDDSSIPTRKSVMVLDSMRRKLGKSFSFDTAPGYGHLVMGRVGGLLPHVAPSSWRAMDDWIKREVLTATQYDSNRR
ncbi:MAG TPA: prolyl oligopeptidase family serine peptidase [Gemmatimonadaceae bacterium]|nr:prolyl oligopeptidase family serine peptidase [Gemmatimonadaceae bacterium]